LKAGATVVEQDAAIEIADHHPQRQFRHQRGKPVLFLLDGGLGDADLRLDIIEQFIALLGKIVGRAGQITDFGRTFGRNAEVPVGAEHQAQRLRHARQAVHVLLEQGAQQDHATDKADQGHESAQRQAWQEELCESLALRILRIEKQQQGGEPEGADHQQTEHAGRNDEPDFRLHASNVLICATRSLVENGLVM